MERVSVEERIRRAEDIYNRRNGTYTRNVSNREKPCKRAKKRKAKRLLNQIFVCLLLYIIFYVGINRNYIFSEDFRKSVGSFFYEKTKIGGWYNSAKGYIESKFLDESKTEDEEIKENKIEQKELDKNKTQEDKKTNENKNIFQEQNKDEKEENKKDENIGGAVENIDNISKEKNQRLTEQQIMENEAKEIKKGIKFIVPLKGRISSTFGWRNPTTTTVPKYHTGVDIAAAEGTKIKSATDGKVIMASSSGDYGKHYQIQIKDVILVYAHCKKLYLKEGDIVKQGQEIAEVGSTGNSTGPHLHFEIRKDGRKIDPQLVLNL